MKLTFAIIAVLSLPALTMAVPMTLTVNGASSVVAQPGDTLPVALSVDTQWWQIAAFDGYFRATANNVLTVSHYMLGVWFPLPPFPDFTPNGPVTTTNSTQNIGGLSFSDLGPGIVTLATFDLSIAPTWDRTPVSMTVFGPLLSDVVGTSLPVTAVPLDIIPEPSALLLLGLGVLTLRRRGHHAA